MRISNKKTESKRKVTREWRKETFSLIITELGYTNKFRYRHRFRSIWNPVPCAIFGANIAVILRRDLTP